MAGSWLSIEVTMLRGNGEEFWPPPGRDFAVGPAHTFAQLAEEIDRSLGRWDLAHLRTITLSDGTVITDPETAAEIEDDEADLQDDPTLEDSREDRGAPTRIGPAIEVARVVDLVRVGDAFRYEFDFGDQWVHRCEVTAAIDPRELGFRPRRPLATFGWGALPDQYGRRWDRDDGTSNPPPRPTEPDAMLAFDWPHEAPTRRVSVDELRVASASGDVDAIVAAVEGRDIVDLLQHVGMAWEVAVTADPARARSSTPKIVEALNGRDAPGDRVLAEDLGALQRGAPGEDRWLTVDLEELAHELEGGDDEETGVLDLTTGEVVPGFMTDPMKAGEDAALDLEDEPDRWLRLWRTGSRDGWHDMADFAARVTVPGVRERLASAIEGRGAFRRFRDLVDREGLAQEWYAFSEERAIGRAREWLAENGIRALPPEPLRT